jgi:hypothetical protein
MNNNKTHSSGACAGLLGCLSSVGNDCHGSHHTHCMPWAGMQGYSCAVLTHVHCMHIAIIIIIIIIIIIFIIIILTIITTILIAIIIIIIPCKPYLSASAPRLTLWGGGKENE